MKCLKVGMLKEGKKSKSIFIIPASTRYTYNTVLYVFIWYKNTFMQKQNLHRSDQGSASGILQHHTLALMILKVLLYFISSVRDAHN